LFAARIFFSNILRKYKEDYLNKNRKDESKDEKIMKSAPSKLDTQKYSNFWRWSYQNPQCSIENAVKSKTRTLGFNILKKTFKNNGFCYKINDFIACRLKMFQIKNSESNHHLKITSEYSKELCQVNKEPLFEVEIFTQIPNAFSTGKLGM